MKTYMISSNQQEEIEFKADGEKFALVQKFKSRPFADSYKTIILNKREILKLFQAIWRVY